LHGIDDFFPPDETFRQKTTLCKNEPGSSLLTGRKDSSIAQRQFATFLFPQKSF